MKSFLFVISVIILFIFQSNAINAKTITGFVIDRATNKPVESGIVMVMHKDKLVAMQVVGSTGEFIFNDIKLDRFTLHVTSSGYGDVLKGPFLISKLDTFKVAVELEPTYLVADEVSVVAKRTAQWLRKEGFYKRKEARCGRFVEPEDLKSRTFNRLTELLQTIPGIIVQPTRAGSRIISVRSNIASLGAMPPVSIILDGVGVDGFESVEYLNPGDIAAVEFYPNSTGAPAQFGGSWRTGGVLILWTKR